MNEDEFYHLEWDTERKYILFREYCLTIMEELPWRNNCIFPETITVENAIDLCYNDNLDYGKLGAVMLMPSNTSFMEWASFYRYLVVARFCLTEIQ